MVKLEWAVYKKPRGDRGLFICEASCYLYRHYSVATFQFPNENVLGDVFLVASIHVAQDYGIFDKFFLTNDDRVIDPFAFGVA